MRQLGAWLCLLVLVTACGAGDTLPAAPSRAPSPDRPAVPSPDATSPQLIRISVWEEVKDTLTAHGTDRLFELTAPSTGVLVVSLGWEPRQGRLQLELADKLFANLPDNWSPIVGTLTVVNGEKYRVRVADGAPWDYDNLLLPFVMTTSLE